VSDARFACLAFASLVVGGALDAFGETAAPAGGNPAAVPAEVRSFVAARCLDCHDDTTREAGVSLEALGDSVTDASASGWLRALEQIERGTMPPPSEEQPDAAERQAMALALEKAVVAHAESMPVRTATVLRRLNRNEYRHTLEDLLHLDLSRSDPTIDFPYDFRTHGFASDGERLVTSSFLMRQYLTAAKDVVGRAIHFEERPQERVWTLFPPFGGAGGPEHAWYANHLKQPQAHQSIVYRRGCMPLEDLRGGVRTAGWYSIRVLAEAKFRRADMDSRKMFLGGTGHDPATPHQLALTVSSLQGIDPANQDAVRKATIGAHGENVTEGGPAVATWDVPDDVPTWLECRIWLEAGQFPRLSFPNGPTDSNNRVTTFISENKYTLLDKHQLAAYESGNANARFDHLLFFETPRIRIHKIEVRGPLNEQWPPESHLAIFGDAPYESAAASDVLQSFAARAWRRPGSAADVEPLMKLVRNAERAAIDAGTPPEQAAREAIAQGVIGVLCAPEFLYREEGADELDGHAIAARLSYFLWASQPDENLLARAAAGDLARPDVRRQEAERLLADPRADRFVTEFLDGWLTMGKLGSMKPQFPGSDVYYVDDLEPAMRTETRLFFKRLLQTNGPIADFLDSDYTFVNRGLANLYRIDWPAVEPSLGKAVDGLAAVDLQPDGAGEAPSQGFALVKLTDRRRGGLLGQASVLTLTANGVDTNPVIRGAWVLENILGAPPSPPPPNIPVIEPDVRGATTLRQRLEKHRDNPSCLSCHRHIDPPGFALEHFDAIGQIRTHYVTGSTAVGINASGEFAGETFKDVVGFKAALLERQPQFARCLVEKMLLHLLGRELTARDRPAVRGIVEEAAAGGYRLRDIVIACCASDLIVKK
jgi:hypothetical protein